MHANCSGILCLACRAHRQLRENLLKFLKQEMKGMRGLRSADRVAVVAEVLVLMGNAIKTQIEEKA